MSPADVFLWLLVALFAVLVIAAATVVAGAVVYALRTLPDRPKKEEQP